MIRRTFLGDGVQFTARIEYGKVTVHPDSPLAGHPDVLLDAGVPAGKAVAAGISGWCETFDVESIMQFARDKDGDPIDHCVRELLRRVPGAERRRVTLVCDYRAWSDEADDAEMYYLYPKGLREPRNPLWTVEAELPGYVRYLRFDSLAQAQYVRDRLKSGKGLPSLPREYIVFC